VLRCSLQLRPIATLQVLLTDSPKAPRLDPQFRQRFDALEKLGRGSATRSGLISVAVGIVKQGLQSNLTKTGPWMDLHRNAFDRTASAPFLMG
jgi:hypothetical protein